MKKIAFVAVVALIGFSAMASAQQNAAWNLLDSPIKTEAEVANAGETLACTLPLGGGTASLFGLDEVPGQNPNEFIGSELGGTWRVFQFDETCAFITSWSTSFPGITLTGLCWDNGNYWGCDPFGTGQIHEFVMGTGVPTGATVNFAAGYPGVWGPIDIDNTVAGPIAPCEDIARDQAVEYNLTSGAIGGIIENPDNGSGLGAYGNGLSAAADPASCSGASMVMASGTISNGQVVRASQVDVSGTVCYSTWDIATPTGVTGEFFVNGISEFISASGFGGGGKRLMCLGNVTSLAYNVGRPAGINDCQGIDGENTLFVNSSLGGGGKVVAINNTYPLGFAMQKPSGGGNGKFIAHLNSGIPSGGTITPLPASLGSFCFPLLIPPFGAGAPVSVWNNIGKTDRVGASNYFGTPIANPTNPPVYFLADGDGDATNFALGSQWTIQAVQLNPASSSPKGASVTNATIIDVTAGI